MNNDDHDPDQLSFDDLFTREWMVDVSFETQFPLDDDDLDEIYGALRATFGSSLHMTPGGHEGRTTLSFWGDVETEVAVLRAGRKPVVTSHVRRIGRSFGQVIRDVS